MKKVPVSAQSPHGWWVASYIERAAWDDERKPSKKKRYLFWENTFILQAKDRARAYEKAIHLATRGRSTFEHVKSGRKGHWEFVGLTSLLPIYEKLGDGAEIYWREYANSTLGKIASKIKKRQQLEAFVDG